MKTPVQPQSRLSSLDVFIRHIKTENHTAGELLFCSGRTRLPGGNSSPAVISLANLLLIASGLLSSFLSHAKMRERGVQRVNGLGGEQEKRKTVDKQMALKQKNRNLLKRAMTLIPEVILNVTAWRVCSCVHTPAHIPQNMHMKWGFIIFCVLHGSPWGLCVRYHAGGCDWCSPGSDWCSGWKTKTTEQQLDDKNKLRDIKAIIRVLKFDWVSG